VKAKNESVPIVVSQHNNLYGQDEASCHVKFRFRDNHYTIYPDSFKVIVDTTDCEIRRITFEHNYGEAGLFRTVKAGYRVKAKDSARLFAHKMDIMYASLYFRFSNEWNGKILILPNKSILCDSVPMLSDTLKVTIKKDSLYFPPATRIRWSDVYSGQIMRTFDKQLAREMIKQWLLSVDKEDVLPDAITTLNFTLRQSPSGECYIIELIGSRHYNTGNNDKMHRFDFVPQQSRCETLKIATTIPEEDVLQAMTKITRSVTRELKKMQLLQVEHITIGTANGNRHVIK
jgi:hypothetical protein